MLNGPGLATVQALPGVLGVYIPSKRMKRDFTPGPKKSGQAAASGDPAKTVSIDVLVSTAYLLCLRGAH